MRGERVNELVVSHRNEFGFVFGVCLTSCRDDHGLLLRILLWHAVQFCVYFRLLYLLHSILF